MVGKQITVEQLIELGIVMRISRYGQASRPRQVDRNDSASTTITPHIDRYPACI